MTEEPTREQLTRAMRIVAVGLKKEARRRSWCGEYEEWVRKINEEVGFDVLNIRVRRQHVSWQCNVMFRGAGGELDEMIDEFVDYVNRFEPSVGISAAVALESVQFQDGSEEEDDTPRQMPEGYDPNASCNCGVCMEERRARAAVQRMPPRPPRFTDIDFA